MRRSVWAWGYAASRNSQRSCPGASVYPCPSERIASQNINEGSTTTAIGASRASPNKCDRHRPTSLSYICLLKDCINLVLCSASASHRERPWRSGSGSTPLLQESRQFAFGPADACHNEMLWVILKYFLRCFFP